MATSVLDNPDFTTGIAGWEAYTPGSSAYTWQSTGGLTTPGCARFTSTQDNDDGSLQSLQRFECLPGEPVNVSISYKMVSGSPGMAVQSAVAWLNSAGQHLSNSTGNQHRRQQVGDQWVTSTVNAVVPPNAAFFRVAAWTNAGSGSSQILVDDVRLTHSTSTATLTSPNGTIAAGSVVPFRVSTGSLSGITAVRYYATAGANPEVLVGTSTAAPWSFNTSSLAPGTYEARAEVVFSNGAIRDTNTLAFVVGAPPPPDTREYKASNSYTYLIAENFVGLAGSIPPTSQIVGMQAVVDYYIEALVRSKDIGVADPSVARYEAAFDMVPSATFETVLLQDDGSDYSQLGTASTQSVDIARSDYTVLEDGISEGKRWTVLRGADKSVTIGPENSIFGMATMPAADIASKALGIRFYPNLAAKPEYADSGDAVFRVHIDKLRVQIYFDAGSVEYYFTSPDRTQVIKGTLASYYLESGDFPSADASGILQLLPELEIMDGSQAWIGNDWTIHAAYPPTDDNYIGDVDLIEGQAPYGMEYNGLPTQLQIKNNRSRYQFITENFYGDPDLNSMYGVHGLPRAFAYNGEYFYKIYTQPDAEKDMPRSVANHHGHLALGYHGGRVDISVVGEPYNFDGALGASSWAFGDKVVGLLPLSGTILGVFGAKSIWGISGTTVDNFATQVISPNIGATEYTITDMGFPVYANAYGIYTLSQTQQYGDYLGQPMSQSISPWLRPRLLRKPTSDKEVVCAWPVRSKNQYRLAFSDGYVTSMTLNGQQVPTFSFQKYFYTPSDPPTTTEWVVVDDFTDSVGGEQ